MPLSLPLGPDALVEEIVRDFPRAVSFLRQWNVVCIKCGEPVWGTLGEVLAAKGLDLDQVLGALNVHLAQEGDETP